MEGYDNFLDKEPTDKVSSKKVKKTKIPAQNSGVVDNGSKPRKRKRKESQKNHSHDKISRKKAKRIPLTTDEGFAEVKYINDIPEKDPRQGDDSGMEDEAAEGVNNVHSADGQTVSNQPTTNQSGTIGNAATRLEKYKIHILFIPNFM